MPTAVNNNLQEYDPRHRLTGAVVLILLAIILLPMLLNKSPDEMQPESEAVVMEVTKEGNKVFVSRISSIKPAPAPTTAESKKQTEAVATTGNEKNVESDKASSALFKPMSYTNTTKSSESKSATVKKKSSSTSSKAAVKTTPAKTSTSKKAVTKKSSTTTASGAWILQVGVFSQSANAKKKVSELKKKGFNAKSGKVKTSKGIATKVWIGPFKDRAAAEKMQDRLQHKTRQRGMVVKK